MPTFTQMRQLMDNDILQTSGILLRQLRVEPDCSRSSDACAPLCLHAAHDQVVDLDLEDRLPLFQQGGDSCFQFTAVPAVQCCVPSFSVSPLGGHDPESVAFCLYSE